jgi:hypothetical protein
MTCGASPHETAGSLLGVVSDGPATALSQHDWVATAPRVRCVVLCPAQRAESRVRGVAHHVASAAAARNVRGIVLAQAALG